MPIFPFRRKKVGLDRRTAICSGEESVLCSTALLRRGFISVDFRALPMLAVPGFTPARALMTAASCISHTSRQAIECGSKSG